VGGRDDVEVSGCKGVEGQVVDYRACSFCYVKNTEYMLVYQYLENQAFCPAITILLLSCR